MTKYKVGDLVISRYEHDIFRILSVDLYADGSIFYMGYQVTHPCCFITFPEDNILPYNLSTLWRLFWLKNNYDI